MARKKIGKWNPSLHPRDARGRFTRSATRTMKGSDSSRARTALTDFSPDKTGGTAAGAGQWMTRNTPATPPGPDSAMGRYLSGGWKDTNTALRREKTPPDGVAEIDAAFAPSKQDLMVRRQVPLAMFAHIPVEDLAGMKVRDAAYASTQLDRKDLGESAPDAVTMHIATPAGTPIYVNPDAGEILLGRDTEVAISRAEPNGRGGWDLYGVVIPKTATKHDRRDTGGDTDGDAGRADTDGTGGGTPAPAEPDGTDAPDGNRDGTDAPSGNADTPDAAPDAGSSPTSDVDTATTGDGGPLGDMEPLDRTRLRIAVEDNAARIFRNPMIGGSKDDVARYVAEGNLGHLVDKHGLPAVWRAVAQDIDDRPELLDRSDADTEQAARQRAEAADLLSGQAARQAQSGDYAAALDTIGKAEALDPDRVDPRGNTWGSLREVIGRLRGDAAPTTDTSAPGPGTPARPGELPGDATTLREALAQLTEEIGEVDADQKRTHDYIQSRIGVFADDRTGLRAESTTVHANGRGAVVGYVIRDRNGAKVGGSDRIFQMGRDGSFSVSHSHLDLDPGQRGAGFAARFNAHNEEFYRANGVDQIDLLANSDVGGYAWARAGYDWQGADDAARVADDLESRLRNGPPGDYDDVTRETAQDLIGRARAARDKARQVPSDQQQAAMAEAVGDAPTPLEFAMLGWTPGAGRGAEAMWPGKRLMLDQFWSGVRKLGPDDGRDRDRDVPGGAAGDATPQPGTNVPAAADAPDSPGGPDGGPDGTAQSGGTNVPAPRDTPATPSAAAPPAQPGDAGPPQQLDIAGGQTAFDLSRTDVGLPERPQVGRERAIAQVQQLGLFASDEREMAGQEALLDALLAMPSADPPPDAPRTPDTTGPSAVPASIVPDDVSGWNDEQLAETFRTVSAADRLDEPGMRRITAEWDRREQAMADLVATVPEDLGPVSDGDLEAMFARLTGELGTMDNATVARLGDELDRRTAVAAADAEAAPKRELLARPVGSLTDAEIDTAAGYAADLGDEAALVRVYAEWDRREQAAQAVQAAEQAAQQARETAARAAAVEAAQAAEREAAVVAAQAAEQRGFDALGAAWAAAVLPPMTGTQIDMSARTLGEPGIRRVMGDEWVDEQFGNWLTRNAGLTVVPTDTRPDVLADAIRSAPDSTKAKILFAAADQGNTAEFVDFSDEGLHNLISRSMFSSVDAQAREQARRAGREQTVRAVRELRQSNVRAFRQAQIRAIGTPVADLSDAEIQSAPALLTVDPPDDIVLARLDEIRGETLRRQADLARIASEKAAGPAGPARLRNPVNQLGIIERSSERTSTREEHAAADRLRRAKATVYGLPETASDKDIRAAARKDPRPLPEQAAQTIAWYRHLGQYEDIPDDLPVYRDWIRGPADEDVPDVPAPLPPANISKPDEVWKQIQTNAQQEAAAGDYETGRRLMRAVARTYGIPSEDVTPDRESLRAIGEQTGPAVRSDGLTPKQRAALFVAEFRRLAAEDGVDPADTLRYGPPDRGGRRPAKASWRESSPDQQNRIDALVARGWDWMDAYSEVHGVDPQELRRSDTGSEQQIKQAYEEYVTRQFRQAEDATRGNLLARSASSRKVDPRSLFSGPWSTARARASEELLRFWADNPRMTYKDFKASLAGGADARAAKERMVTAGKGNEFA